MTDGPAPFVSRLIMRESVPDEAKDAIQQMGASQLCFTLVTIAAIGLVATYGVNALLERINRREGRCR